jgi:hypothetical protein
MTLAKSFFRYAEGLPCICDTQSVVVRFRACVNVHHSLPIEFSKSPKPVGCTGLERVAIRVLTIVVDLGREVLPNIPTAMVRADWVRLPGWHNRRREIQ